MSKVFAILAWMILAAVPFLNHIVYCFQSEKYLLLIAGVLVAPVGWLHGFGLFFGWW